MATLKKDKAPCRICGKVTAIATYNYRLRHRHNCPHGRVCQGSVSWADKCDMDAASAPHKEGRND